MLNDETFSMGYFQYEPDDDPHAKHIGLGRHEVDILCFY